MEPENEYKRSPAGRIMSGIIIIGVGVILLMRQMGTLFPAWLFTWQMAVIVIGSYIGVRHGFRWRGWILVIMMSLLLLLEHLYPGFRTSELFWPLLIILVGLSIIFRPRRRWGRDRWEEKWKHKWKDKWDEKSGKKWERDYGTSTEHGGDRIDSVSVFGGVRKVIVSKDFKGGEITTIFGGAEIDLSQADITGKISLEITQVFGGTNLIIPPHWQIQSDMVSIMGSIEDKRPAGESTHNPDKILVLHGTSIMAGIDIRSY
ncbi:MAG TPA: LiaF domain-containing protein [Bacteroidia bacterium]|jgi:predicted membrane protein|nr:LiaF domain-containing protein [Bacteroidia bacterium]